MGILTSNYMNTYAIRMTLQLQHKKMNLQLKAARVQRNMGNAQKAVNMQKRRSEQGLQYNYQIQNSMLNSSIQGLYDSDGKISDQAKYNDYQNSIFNNRMSYQYSKSAMDQYFEDLYEQYLEPLKDEEEDIRTELVMVDQQLTFWQQMKENYGKEGQEAIKDFVGN